MASKKKYQPSTSTKQIMVLDGCFRSQLKVLDKTYESEEDYVKVNIDDPDMAQKVHKSFLEAGANVIRTNTHRASEDLLRCSLRYSKDEIRKYFVKSVENARKAVEDYTSKNKKEPKDYMVVGSCGSYTDCRFSKVETVNRQEYKKYHRLRAKSLIKAKVDMLAFESIPVAEEAYAIVELMNKLPYSQYWISFRCANKKLLCDSELSDVARKCYEQSQQKICAVGINCVDPTDIPSALCSIKNSTKIWTRIPLVAYPHSGIINQSNSNWRPFVCKTQDTKPVPIPVPAQEWLYLNVRYVGGCCRVLPNNIESIRKEVDDHYKKS